MTLERRAMENSEHYIETLTAPLDFPRHSGMGAFVRCYKSFAGVFTGDDAGLFCERFRL